MAVQDHSIWKFPTKTLEDFPHAGEEVRVVSMRKPQPMYLRFGHYQSECGERSMNWSTGEYERGISVYPAAWTGEGIGPDSDWLWDIKQAWHLLVDRTRYALTGRVIGEGSDGEPVLAVSSIVVRGVWHLDETCGVPIILPGDLDRAQFLTAKAREVKGL